MGILSKLLGRRAAGSGSGQFDDRRQTSSSGGGISSSSNNIGDLPSSPEEKRRAARRISKAERRIHRRSLRERTRGRRGGKGGGGGGGFALGAFGMVGAAPRNPASAMAATGPGPGPAGAPSPVGDDVVRRPAFGLGGGSGSGTGSGSGSGTGPSRASASAVRAGQPPPVHTPYSAAYGNNTRGMAALVPPAAAATATRGGALGLARTASGRSWKGYTGPVDLDDEEFPPTSDEDSSPERDPHPPAASSGRRQWGRGRATGTGTGTELSRLQLQQLDQRHPGSSHHATGMYGGPIPGGEASSPTYSSDLCLSTDNEDESYNQLRREARNLLPGMTTGALSNLPPVFSGDVLSDAEDHTLFAGLRGQGSMSDREQSSDRDGGGGGRAGAGGGGGAGGTSSPPMAYSPESDILAPGGGGGYRQVPAPVPISALYGGGGGLGGRPDPAGDHGRSPGGGRLDPPAAESGSGSGRGRGRESGWSRQRGGTRISVVDAQGMDPWTPSPDHSSSGSPGSPENVNPDGGGGPSPSSSFGKGKGMGPKASPFGGRKQHRRDGQIYPDSSDSEHDGALLPSPRNGSSRAPAPAQAPAATSGFQRQQHMAQPRQHMTQAQDPAGRAASAHFDEPFDDAFNSFANLEPAPFDPFQNAIVPTDMQQLGSTAQPPHHAKAHFPEQSPQRAGPAPAPTSGLTRSRTTESAKSVGSASASAAAKDKLRQRRREKERARARAGDGSDSDGADGDRNESWLFDGVKGALGPRGIAADLESMSGRSTGNKSHRSRSSRKSRSRRKQRSDGSVGSRDSRYSHKSYRSTRSQMSHMSDQSRSVANDLLRLEMQLAMVGAQKSGDGASVGSRSSRRSRTSRTSRTSRGESSRRSSAAKRSKVTIVAPAGKLGIILANKTDSKGTVVSGVRTSSVLSEKVGPGDRIIAIDGEDVSRMTVSEITTIMARKSEFERVLSVLTTSKTHKPTSSDLPTQVGVGGADMGSLGGSSVTSFSRSQRA